MGCPATIGASTPQGKVLGRGADPDALCYHYFDHGGEHQVARHYGIRTDRSKLIHCYTTDEWELFDLGKDLRELTNVYDDPGFTKVRRQLHRDLNDLKAKLGNTVYTVADQEALEARFE